MNDADDRRDEQQALWSELDAYVNASCLSRDASVLAHLDAAQATSDAAGLPRIQVSAAMGKQLALLVRALRAERVLEIGTLGGYSTIWLASGLGAGGRVVTLELSERHAAVASENIARAGFADRVEVVVGPALASLEQMETADSGGDARGGDAFDVVFIDADKENSRPYLEHALRLTRPGGLIIVDNVIRDGRVLDGTTDDASVLGVRAMYDYIAGEPRLSATAVQTVGEKGHDGVLLAMVGA